MSDSSSQPRESVTSISSAPRIALIGCGAIAEGYYLPALARCPGVLEKLILVDQDANRAKKLAAAFSVQKTLTDYRKALPEVDGVVIALPTHLHHPVAMEFLSRGVHVLCEKPLAESANKAREMVHEAQRAGVGLATDYQQRLLPQFNKVKETIADGSLGGPVRIKYQVGEVFDWPTASGFYFNSVGSARGILRDRGAHVLDHICWWLGVKPRVLSCQNDSFGGSDAVAFVQFEHNHCVGEVMLSWLSKFPCRFVVEFERGSIEGELYYPQSVLLKTGDGPQKRVAVSSVTPYKMLRYRIVDNFIGVLLGTEKPLVPGADVLESISLIDECYAVATRFAMPWYELFEVPND
jgi:predicted dehydrogenase